MGRGAVNQKGPQAAFLAALHAIRAAGRKPPVNLVLVGEGEEELGSPHFKQVAHRPDIAAALKRCQGMRLPSAQQSLDGAVEFGLGGKGIVEFELESSGQKWGRGATKDVHSSQKARIDSPVWHLVQAMNTLVTADGADPAIEGLDARARPPSAAERAMLDDAARRRKEETEKKVMGVRRWAKDVDFRGSLERLAFRPTVNIQGLVAGYGGPGGKTVMPHRALAKCEVRLVPDMRPEDVLPAIRAHLAKRGFGDIDVRALDGPGYLPTTTARDSLPVKVALSVYQKSGIDPIVFPRTGGSWPGYLFTDKPLEIPAVHF